MTTSATIFGLVACSVVLVLTLMPLAILLFSVWLATMDTSDETVQRREKLNLRVIDGGKRGDFPRRKP